VVLAQPGSAQVQRAFAQWPGGDRFPPSVQILGGVLKQPGNVLRDRVESARVRGGRADL
jgi:hypothetical protein